MVRCVHIDFETRSKVNLGKQGTWNYASDPSTSIICCAYAVDDGEPKLIIGDGYPINIQTGSIQELKELASDPDTIFYAHNATFEMRIWEHQLHPKYGVPVVPIERWVCTMALAYMFNLPGSLDKVGEALNLNTKKDSKGKTLITQLCSPTKISKTKKENYIEIFWDKYEDQGNYVPLDNDETCGYYWDNTPEKMYEFYDYCITDVKVEHNLTKMLPRLIPFERKIWELDKKMNKRGMQIDLELIDCADSIFKEHKERLKPVFKAITGIAPTQVSKVIDWLINQGVEERKFVKYVIEKGEKVRKLSIDAKTIEKLLEDPTISEVNKKVIEIRKVFSKSSLAKYSAFKKLSDKNGILRDYLIWGRAVTNRWGGNGAQPQNLPSRGCSKNQELLIKLIKMKDYELLKFFYPNISHALSSAIRGVIIAREGHDLIVSDYSAIEARVLMWLAGDKRACDIIVKSDKSKDVEDLYVDMARVIYEDPTITKKKDPTKRDVGKQAVLGCGYGMGPDKFKETCDKFGIEVTLALAKKAVYSYRDKYYKVPELWKDVNSCAIDAVRNPGTKRCVSASGNKVYYVCQGSYLYCVLPSGRFIAYPHPEVRLVEKDFGNGPVEQLSLTYMKEDSMQGNKWVRVDTYGGKLVENIVQAIARDIMAIGGMNCEEHGYNLLLMVHDEAITEVPENFGTIEECERLLATLPAWAEGCPIKAADGWREKRYRK